MLNKLKTVLYCMLMRSTMAIRSESSLEVIAMIWIA